ncbi:hypothetical protein IID23_04585 [Patescibacteria group bacterium]|nr:hypothetical protein [Patescibacteria group bacterium]
MSYQTETLKKWQEWLLKIQQELEELLLSRRMFNRYIEIVVGNPKIHEPSDFHDWTKTNYVSYAASTIRRQLDFDDKDVISIGRLLEQIKKSPNLLTKDWNRNHYPVRGPNIADANFKEFAGSGDHIDPKIIEEDINKLLKLGENIEKFATRRIAHSSKKPIRKVTMTDLNIFIDELDRILSKYILLFTGSQFDSSEPILQYDWDSIFKEKWIL